MMIYTLFYKNLYSKRMTQIERLDEKMSVHISIYDLHNLLSLWALILLVILCKEYSPIQPPHVLSISRDFFLFQSLRKHTMQTKVNSYSKIARTLIFCQTFCPFLHNILNVRLHLTTGLTQVYYSTIHVQVRLNFTHLRTFLHLNKYLKTFLHLHRD